MRRIFWLTVTIFTIILISAVVLTNVYSFKRFIKADCDDQETISKVYENQSTKNFLKGHPDHGFEPQGNRKSFPSQCMYWFYDADGVKQSNLWVVIDTERHNNDFTMGICFDHDSKEPRKISPFDVPDLTSENCNYAY